MDSLENIKDNLNIRNTVSCKRLNTHYIFEGSFNYRCSFETDGVVDIIEKREGVDSYYEIDLYNASYLITEETWEGLVGDKRTLYTEFDSGVTKNLYLYSLDYKERFKV